MPRLEALARFEIRQSKDVLPERDGIGGAVGTEVFAGLYEEIRRV